MNLQFLPLDDSLLYLTVVARTFCECEASAALRHTCLLSMFLEPEDVRSLSLGTIWKFLNRYGLDFSLSSTK